jgi:broad specificity phosphatase PhoE
MRRILSPWLAAALVSIAVSSHAAGADDEQIYGLLKSGGQVVLMRHAVTTPGVGDPPGMRVDDCKTQRNLTDEGRRHAKAIGEALRARGISFAEVQSSPMCRCMETAKLAFGRVDEIQNVINPGAGDTEMPRQVRGMRALATEKRRSSANVVLVSHGTTIAAVTGINPEPGEMLVVSPQGDGKFELRGRLKIPAPAQP